MKQPRLIDISKIWYRPDLMPKYERPVLIRYKICTGIGTWYKYEVITLHKLTGEERWMYEKAEGMLKWCYIEDILP